MYSHILVPVDGSDHAMNAVKAAVSLCKGGTAAGTITLLYVQIDLTRHSNVFLTYPNLDERLKLEGEAILNNAAKMLTEEGIRYDSQINYGDPAKEICDLAQKGNYDLIVMGSRGLGAMAELAVGSVSHKVIQHTSLPVLIVK